MASKKVESGPYRHHLAPFANVNGGAEEFAFERPTSLPLISFRGIARNAGQFLPFGSGETRISLHPIGAPQGLPQTYSELYIPESEEETSSGAASQ